MYMGREIEIYRPNLEVCSIFVPCRFLSCNGSIVMNNDSYEYSN